MFRPAIDERCRRRSCSRPSHTWGWVTTSAASPRSGNRWRRSRDQRRDPARLVDGVIRHDPPDASI